MTPESQPNLGKGKLHVVRCNFIEYPYDVWNKCGRIMRHFIPPDYPSSPIEEGKSWLFELKAKITGVPTLRYDTPKCSRHDPHPSNK